MFKKRRSPTANERALVTDVSGAAEMLDKSRDKVYDLIRAGKLESYLDGRCRRITIVSIREYVAKMVAASGEFERHRYPGSDRQTV